MIEFNYSSIHNGSCHPILFYHPKKLLYQLYNIILQYTQHPNFYFIILLIKIIYLHNKIIYSEEKKNETVERGGKFL